MNPLPISGFSRLPDLKASFPAFFADYIRQRHLRAGKPSPQADFLADIAAFLAHALERGHVCLDLRYPPDFFTRDLSAPVQLPPLPHLLHLLHDAAGPCLSLNADNADNRQTPLILTRDQTPRLYLQRYYRYERELEANLKAKLFPLKSLSPRNSPLSQLFERYDETAPTPQQKAVQCSLESSLSIVSGGPGTGKTTVALQIIAAHLINIPDCTVFLAAPTGKAAVRIEESISNNLPRMVEHGLPASIAEQIRNLRASTLHRLLGSRPNSPYFRHSSTNPLPAELIIVDECSMIDLPLMAKLMDALPPEAHLVLLGDPHQLPSVEVGSVFADIIHSRTAQPVTTTLTQNFRAREAPEIVNLCNHIRKGTHKPQAVLQSLSLSSSASWTKRPSAKSPAKSLSLTSSPTSDASPVIWHPIEHPGDLRALLDHAASFYRVALDSKTSPAEAFTASLEFRILTAVRDGPFGMNRINDHLLARLPQQHQLVIINCNEPNTGLFNGDMGILPANEPDARAWFPSTGPIARLRLPPHTPAYAMTGHRAQGSEFGEVHVVLPHLSQSGLLTRKWLYTAISRARNQIHLWASETSILQCLTNPTRRLSGLFS